MERGTLIAIILLSLLIAILFIPSVHIYNKAYYTSSPYGWGTHWVYKKGMGNGYFYGLSEDGDLYFEYMGKYEKFIDRPEHMWNEPCYYYLSDSVIYVGDWRGRIYYADPESGRIIWTIELSRLHIYFNVTNSTNTFYWYDILYGNKSGYFYLFFNNTIYHLYRDVKILDKFHYNFTGFPVSAHWWDGGLIIKFGRKPKPWLYDRYTYDVYYIKNDKILWKLSLPSKMFTVEPDAPDVYIVDDYVYHFNNSKITIYKDGKIMREVNSIGNIVSIKKMDNKFYVFTYKDTKNILLLYDDNFTLQKIVELFDMKDIGIRKYDITNQKVSFYENKTGYTAFLYTTFGHIEERSYIPLRVVHLNKNLSIDWKYAVDTYRASDIYPLSNAHNFLLVDAEFNNLYFVNVKTKIDINYFAWMSIKIPIFIFLLIIPAYIYVLSKEIRIRRGMPPENL